MPNLEPVHLHEDEDTGDRFLIYGDGTGSHIEVNRLTTILLDIFEDQMDLGRLTTMSEATRLLDTQLRGLGRQVLRGGGRVSMADAKRHAEREYDKYKAAQKKLRHEQADRTIAEIKATQKAIGRKKPKA